MKLPNVSLLISKKNEHGDCLLEFLIDAKLCTVIGRIDHLNDNFTCVSTKGKSVVDYIITSHGDISCCKSFQVLTMNDVNAIFANDDIYVNKLSDHSILITEIDVHFKEDCVYNNVPDANKNVTEKDGCKSYIL